MAERERQPSESTPLLNSEEHGQASPEGSLKPYIRPLIATNFMSLLCGMGDGCLGVIIPRLKEYYDIPLGTVSMLFLFSSCGFFLSALFNGYLVHRFGQLNTLYIGACSMLLTFLVMLNGLAFPITAGVLVFQGIGSALLDGGMNVFTANVPQATLMLSIVHAVYGVGAMISPLVASTLLIHDLSWTMMYVFLACAALVNIALITYGFWNVSLEDKSDNKEESTTSSEFQRKALFNRMSLLGASYILVYVGVEVTLGGWGYTFLLDGRHGDQVDMGHVVSGYWAGLAVGRILLGYVAGRWGEKRTITVVTMFTAVFLVVMRVSANITVDAIALVTIGLLLGPMFPTTISIASKVLPRNMHATSIGFIAAFGAGGAALFPFVAGMIASQLGILSMPIVCLCMVILMQVLWYFIPSGEKKLSPGQSEDDIVY